MKKAIEFIIEDGNLVFKAVRPGKSIKQIKQRFSGNGNFIRIKDKTNDYPLSLDKIRKALERANFGEHEIDLITYLIQEEYENTF